MAAEEQTRLQIGHVLFIDIVGYFKLLITDQSDQLQTLKQIVRGTEQFRIAEAAGKLLRLPTGDDCRSRRRRKRKRCEGEHDEKATVPQQASG